MPSQLPISFVVFCSYLWLYLVVFCLRFVQLNGRPTGSDRKAPRYQLLVACKHSVMWCSSGHKNYFILSSTEKRVLERLP